MMSMLGLTGDIMEGSFNGLCYRAAVARREELEGLHRFCTRIVPGGFAALELWRERYDKNPNIFYMVKAFDEGRPGGEGELVGSFAVTPVTEEARKLLDQEKLKGVGFTPEHIAAPGDKPAAIYISGIVARGFTAKGMTLRFLNDLLEREAGRGNRLFYARPMSEAGLRLMGSKGFSPVDPSADGQLDRIYVKKA